MAASSAPGPDRFVPGRVEFAPGLGAAAGLVGVGGPFLPGYAGTTESVVANVVGDPFAFRGPTVVNERTSLTIPAFFRGVTFLSATTAHLPVDVCRKVGGVRSRVDGHQVETAMNVSANPLADPVVVRQTWLEHAIVHGNGYLYVERDDAGQWTGNLFNLLPFSVRPFRFVGLSGGVEQWYAVWLPGQFAPTAVPAADVLHIMGPSPDGMAGYPVVSLMAQNLSIARSAEAFGAAFFEQGGHLGGTVETDKVLTREQVDTLKSEIQEGYTGIRNAHKFMILMGGAKAKPLTMPPDTAQYIETRNLAVIDIARMLGVFPWYLFDMARATWGNAAQQGVDTVQYSLLPWIIRCEQQVAGKLLTPAERAAGLFVRFNVDALQRGDHVQQLDSTTKRLSCGLTNLDEERALYDLPPLPDGLGQLRTVPVNQQSLQRAAAPDPTGSGAVGSPAGTARPPATEDDDAQQFAAQQPRPPIVDRTHFAPLIRAAADRVKAKVSAVRANAVAKYPQAATDQGHRDSFNRWADAFADEMGGYTTVTIQPMLETLHALTPLDVEPADLAARVGREYAGQLRSHLTSLPDSPGASAPSLSPLLINALAPASLEQANV